MLGNKGEPMDKKRRALLSTGVAVAAAAAAPRAFAQAAPAGGAAGQFYQKGNVRIHYQEAGSGIPLLIIPGGGQNSTIAWAVQNAPFNAIDEFKGEYRCITADLRNAPSGQSTGPLEIDRPWDSYTDDHLGLMDHLGIKRFMVLGLLHRRPVHLEPVEARAGSRHRRRRVAAGRVPQGDTDPRVRQLHEGLGPAAHETAARDHDGYDRPLSPEHVRRRQG